MSPWKGEEPLEKAKIDRINALAAKSKAQGLTGPEKEEQAALRQEFLADFRAGFKAQLENNGQKTYPVYKNEATVLTESGNMVYGF